MKIEKIQNIEMLQKLKQAVESQIKRINDGEQSDLTVEDLQEDMLRIDLKIEEITKKLEEHLG